MRTPAGVQSTVKRCLLFTVDTGGGYFDNEEYIKSYGQMYNQYTDTLAVLLVHVGLAPIIEMTVQYLLYYQPLDLLDCQTNQLKPSTNL